MGSNPNSANDFLLRTYSIARCLANLMTSVVTKQLLHSFAATNQ